MKNKAFSLPELVVVITLIALLSVFVLPKFVDVLAGAKERSTMIEMSEIMTAIVGKADTNEGGFLGDMKRVPTNAEGLTALYSDSGMPAYNFVTLNGWNGPYIGEDSDGSGSVSAAEAYDILHDEWKNAYLYSTSTSSSTENATIDGSSVTVTISTINITITSWGPNGASGGGDDLQETRAIKYRKL